MKSIYKKFIVWLMGTKIYEKVVMKIVPFIRFSTYYPDFTGFQFKRGYALLKKGDFVLVKDNKKLTGILIPGEWDHAAQIIDVGSEWEVSEMTHTNYTKSCFFDICAKGDRVAIFRCPKFDDNYIDNVVIPTCKSFSPAIYDVEFKGAEVGTMTTLNTMQLGIPALYCSELIYLSDPEKRLGADLTDLIGIGRPYISPDGLAKAANVYCVWDSDNDKVGPII